MAHGEVKLWPFGNCAAAMLFLVSYAAFPQAITSPVQIQVSTLKLSQGEPRIYVTLGNRSAGLVENISIRLEEESGTRALPGIPALLPSQWLTVEGAVISRKSLNAVLVVEYKLGKQVNSISTPVSTVLGSNHPTLAAMQPFGAVVGGALAALAGAIVTAIFTARRERARARFEWSKFLFERYEAHYRRFVTFAAGTTDPNQIRRYFEQLEQNALVSPNARRLVADALEALSVDTRENKADVRDRFLVCFAETVGSPSGDIRQFLVAPLGR